MKVKVLEEMLRRIVKQEVAKAVKKELGSKNVVNESASLSSLMDESQPVSKKVEASSGKKSLNQLLAETKGFNDPTAKNASTPQVKPGMEEYPTMGGGTFDSKRANELIGSNYAQMMNGGQVDTDIQRQQAAANTAQAAGRNFNDLNDGLQKALTRNYGDVMKAIDKKKAEKVGGIK